MSTILFFILGVFAFTSIIYALYIIIIKPIISFFTPKEQTAYKKEETVSLAFEKSITGVPYYLIVDIETSGLPSDRYGDISDSENWPYILQLAWIVLDSDFKEVKGESCYLRYDGEISYYASEISGITTSLLYEKGIDRLEALKKFNSDLASCQYMVAHNMDFDGNIIEAEFYRNGLNFPLKGNKMICTMMSTIEFCGLPDNKYPKLLELFSACFYNGRVLTTEGLHNSETDVGLTAKCFEYLVNKRILLI